MKVKLAWWRKLIPRRRQKQRAAGDRKPKGKRNLSTTIKGLRKVVTTIMMGLLVIAVLSTIFTRVKPDAHNPVTDKVTSARNWVGRKAGDIKRFFIPEFVPVHATGGVNATSALPDHEADKAADGFNNTFWQVNSAKDAKPVLVVVFAQPVDLAQMIVTSGAFPDFQAEPRPETIHLVYSDGKSQDIKLIDQSKPQTHRLKGAKGVTKVEFHFVSTYPSLKGKNMSLAEIEFFVRKQ